MVLLDDLLRGSASIKTGHDSVEGYAGATDADPAVSVGLNRNPLWWNVQFHEGSVGTQRRAVNLPSRAIRCPRGMLNSDVLIRRWTRPGSALDCVSLGERRGERWVGRSVPPCGVGINSSTAKIRTPLGHTGVPRILRCCGHLLLAMTGGGFRRPTPEHRLRSMRRKRSGGVSDPLPNTASALSPDPGGSLTPPLRRCLFTWHAAVHASRRTSAMPRALTPPVFLPTRARRTRQRSDLRVVPHVGLIVARPWTNVSPVSIHAHARRIVVPDFQRADSCLSLPLVDMGYGRECRKRHTKRP